ncbi:tRNA lysidine(34) synthetase TilS [Cereibacter changlensis]|uniref:tRNA lysidine(34) synthetase TilS n=1 Tax=Cereibacter changlensis TaxID=402884 RepID=UPI0040333335
MPAPLLQRFLQGPGLAEAPVLGLAVSGGSDSLGLLHLAVEAGLTCHAVTVDHGLRPEAAAEAETVARICAGLGVPHQVLRWQGWDRRGNLQDQARRARYRLIADWARAQGIGAVALGHTRDDLAETFLMRLARGAGVDGLSAMQASRFHLGLRWLRPLLAIGRAELRADLAARGVVWADDPSNDNPAFDRVRVRRAMAGLDPLGLDAPRLAEVAGHLAEVREALEAAMLEAARRHARIDAGDVLLDRAVFDLPAEILRRLLVQALAFVSSAEYGPRGPALRLATERLRQADAVTLHGCRLAPGRHGLRIYREARAVEGCTAAPDALWDGRWRMSGPQNNGLEVRMLGVEGLAACKDWRATGRPRDSLIASPAVWQGDRLVAAPLAGWQNGWAAATGRLEEAFFLSVLSH